MIDSSPIVYYVSNPAGMDQVRWKIEFPFSWTGNWLSTDLLYLTPREALTIFLNLVIWTAAQAKRILFNWMVGNFFSTFIPPHTLSAATSNDTRMKWVGRWQREMEEMLSGVLRGNFQHKLFSLILGTWESFPPPPPLLHPFHLMISREYSSFSLHVKDTRPARSGIVIAVWMNGARHSSLPFTLNVAGYSYSLDHLWIPLWHTMVRVESSR